MEHDDGGDEGARDPLGLITGGEGLITGTVVCAAVIAYTAGSVSSTGELCLAIFGTVIVYWLAHLHAMTVGLSIEHRHHPLSALRLALGRTWLVAGASVLPVAVLLVAEIAGAELKTAAWEALFATVFLLTGYSYLAGVRSGLGLGGRLASAAAGAALGLLVVLLKVLLH